MSIDVLDDYGFNYKEGLSRCINDEELYKKLLSLFLEDNTILNAEKAIENEDYSRVFSCMHELKGACGNLGMTALYEAVSVIVETLRNKQYDKTIIVAQLEKIKERYNTVCTGIRKVLS